MRSPHNTRGAQASSPGSASPTPPTTASTSTRHLGPRACWASTGPSPSWRASRCLFGCVCVCVCAHRAVRAAPDPTDGQGGYPMYTYIHTPTIPPGPARLRLFAEPLRRLPPPPGLRPLRYTQLRGTRLLSDHHRIFIHPSNPSTPRASRRSPCGWSASATTPCASRGGSRPTPRSPGCGAWTVDCA